MEKIHDGKRPASQAPARRSPPAVVFRTAIEAAVADGVAPEDMKLWLTLTDMSQLKRDPNLAISDISYAGGVMRFLNVPVTTGGVSESRLDRE